VKHRNQSVQSPASVVFGVDLACLELVFAGEEFVESCCGVWMIRWEKLAQGRFKIKVEKNFSDVEEEIWHGGRNFKF